jgi:hypothetical protein
MKPFSYDSRMHQTVDLDTESPSWLIWNDRWSTNHKDSPKLASPHTKSMTLNLQRRPSDNVSPPQSSSTESFSQTFSPSNNFHKGMQVLAPYMIKKKVDVQDFGTLRPSSISFYKIQLKRAQVDLLHNHITKLPARLIFTSCSHHCSRAPSVRPSHWTDDLSVFSTLHDHLSIGHHTRASHWLHHRFSALRLPSLCKSTTCGAFDWSISLFFLSLIVRRSCPM